jgi:phospholipase C
MESPMSPRYVFVLMLENRSFDHFFGQSGIPGVSRPDPASWPTVSDNAKDRVSSDLGHELQDVAAELRAVNGVPMKGFESMPHAQDAMAAFGTTGAPVVRALAREFLLFDNWFSSMPGPTWPNRFFIHAASSGGLTNSPNDGTSIGAVTISSLEFSFEHGSIFDRLDAAGKSWRVYHAGPFPQVLAVKGMVARYGGSRFFRNLHVASRTDAFAKDLTHGDTVDYTFLEPDHGIPFGDGDSQHPPFSVAKGERLIKYVYETLRASPIWNDSALLITWDEHGGFFDHVEPPPGTPPGDRPVNHGREDVQPSEFDFASLGVRVPALLVSPRVPRGGLGSQIFPNATFDHASVVRVLRELFDPNGVPLTQRDASAPSWLSAVGAGIRQDCPARLPDPNVAQETRDLLARNAAAATEALPDKSSVDGYFRIARAVDLSLAQQGVSPRPVADEHLALMQHQIALQRVVGMQPAPQLSVAEKLNYIQHVSQTLSKAKAAH